MSEDSNELVENGRNKTNVYCLRCPSRILSSGHGELVEREFPLPMMEFKAGGDHTQKESFDRYWMVDNMYSFENIGFSKDADGLKYLLCADCEIGPVGYHDLKTKNSYVALKRVRHTDSVPRLARTS